MASSACSPMKEESTVSGSAVSPGNDQSLPSGEQQSKVSSVSSTADSGRSHPQAQSASESRKQSAKQVKAVREFSKHRGDGAGAPLEPKRVWLRSPHWLTPSYRSKNEEFRKLFKKLPADAMLIDDYSCAVQKDILIHGRMYVSQEYLCFYSNIFGYEKSIVIPLTSIDSITPEKTAYLFPNALRIGLKSGRITSSGKEKDKTYWFASFMSRDTSFTILMKVWQNILMGSPMTPINLRHFACRCWGDKPDVDLISQSGDESDGENGDADNANDGEDGGESEDESEGEDEGEVECGCESHVDACYVDQVYPVKAEALFNLFFGNSDWWKRLSNKRKLTDMQTGEWAPVEDGQGEKRDVVYTMPVKASIGPSKCVTTEQQHLQESTAGRLYKVRVEVTSAGVPYGDNFYTYVEYCITYVTRRSARLRIGACMRYRKSMMGFIKSMIEKQAAETMKEFYTMLKKSLVSETAKKRKGKKNGAKGEAGKGDDDEDALEEKSNDGEEDAENAEKKKFSTAAFLQCLAIAFIFLLLLNAGLITRLFLLSGPSGTMSSQQPATGELPGTVEGWQELLVAQRQDHQAEINRMKQTLSTSGELLAQVIQSLEDYSTKFVPGTGDSCAKLQKVRDNVV